MRGLNTVEIRLLLDNSERFPDEQEWAQYCALAERGLGMMIPSDNYPNMSVFVPNRLGVLLAKICQKLEV